MNPRSIIILEEASEITDEQWEFINNLVERRKKIKGVRKMRALKATLMTAAICAVAYGDWWLLAHVPKVAWGILAAVILAIVWASFYKAFR